MMATYNILPRYKPFGLWFATLNVLVLISLYNDEISLESSIQNIRGQSQLFRHIKRPYTRATVSERYYSNVIFVRKTLFVFLTVLIVTWLITIMLLSGDIELNPGPVSISSQASSVTEINTLTDLLTMPNNFSFIQYNVQSILNKLDILTAELSNFDVLSFTETWLNNSIETDDLLIPSYHRPERKDRTHDSHGGVILYVKDFIYYERRSDFEP